MRVKIGPYNDYIGPYQIAEKILFFIPKYDKDSFEYSKAYDKYVHSFGEWLSEDKNGDDSWLTKVCQWIHSKSERTIKVKIHPYDTWSMDHTLAYIILPMLKQLRDTKHGSPMIDLEDVPESMRTIDHEDHEAQSCFEFYHEPDLQKIQCDLHDRWNWVLNEMIWAFEQLVDDNDESQFFDYSECNSKTPWDLDYVGPKVDWDGLNAHNERKRNGFRLFGKYYQGLWD